MPKLSSHIFESLFNKHYQTLCSFAYGFVKNEQAAEDIVQDRFIKLWQQEIEFTHTQQVKSWLYTAVRNASLDWLRQQQRLQNKYNGHAYLQNMETETFKLQQMIRAEVLEEIYTVIDTLPPACHKVFTMFYLEGKNLRKIAEELNLSINTIKSHKAKGLAILRQKLPPIAFSMALMYLITL